DPPESGCFIEKDVVDIRTSRAMEAVQESLKKQGRKPLQMTDRALLAQLRQDGWLLAKDGEPLNASGRDGSTFQIRIAGEQGRGFRVGMNRLLGEGGAAQAG